MKFYQKIFLTLIQGCTLGWVCGELHAAQATLATPGSASKTASPTVTAPIAVPIPKSVFVYEHVAGSRDPFFPNSTRRQARSKDTPESKPLSLTVLPTLKGIMRGPKNKNLALIEDKIFGLGEMNRMVMSGREVAVRCLDIRSNAVVITVNSERHTLPLTER